MLKKKITSLLIGTNNKGKLREIKDLLPKNIKTYSTSRFNLKSYINTKSEKIFTNVGVALNPFRPIIIP